jgi:hypothetical protein
MRRDRAVQARYSRGARRAAGIEPASVKDESLSDPALLPAPEVIAAQIVEDATAGVEAFAAVAAELAVRDGVNGELTGADKQAAVEALLPDDPDA